METDKQEFQENAEATEEEPVKAQEDTWDPEGGIKFENMVESVKKALSGSGNQEAPQNVFVINTLKYLGSNKGIVGDHVDIETLTMHNDDRRQEEPVRRAGNEKNILEDRKKLVAWMEAHYADFELAFLIALSVFEKFPYLWVYELAESLFEKMQDGQEEKEEKRKEKEKIPKNRRVEDIGGQLYTDVIQNHTGKVASEFICFQKEEYADRVLKCVWEEFVPFRETVIAWAVQYIFERNYSKTILAVQALSKFAVWDFYYFQSHVVKSLMSQKNIVADFASAQIMVRAGQEACYRENVEAQFRHWATLGNLHSSLTALMLCAWGKWDASKMYQAVECYIDWLIRDIYQGGKKGYLEELPTFFAIGGRKAFYYKAVVSALYDRMEKCGGRQGREEKHLIGTIFLLLLEVDDKLSVIDLADPGRHKDMIFVKMCLIQNEVTPKVLGLWNFIWSDRKHREHTKGFLEHYLYQYGGCNPKQEKYLQTFLFSFTGSDRERASMEYFLKRISGRRLKT